MSPDSRRARRKRRPLPPGTTPGSLHVDPQAPAPELRVLAFGPDTLEERGDCELDEVVALRDEHPVVWVDVVGLGDAQRLRALGEAFGIHPLAMEDVANLDQRPKAEQYEQALFVVLRMVTPDARDADEQLSLFMSDGLVVSFQERHGDCFAAVRDRLHRAGRLRRSGADYLAYALIDAVIDAYRPALDEILERLEQLEAVLLENPSFDPVPHLHDLRRRLNQLRHQVLPVREVLLGLTRDDSGLMTDETVLFLRDCQDHQSSLADGIENGRDLVTGLVDMSVALVGRRMNEAMMVLTIIATVFIPLSFVTGLYGMNFDTSVSPWNMPELRQPWGYPAVLALMLLMVTGMLTWFRRKGWVGKDAYRLRAAEERLEKRAEERGS